MHRILKLALALTLPCTAAVPCVQAQSCGDARDLGSLDSNPAAAVQVTDYAYDSSTQQLFAASTVFPFFSNPKIDRRAGSGWVTILDPFAYVEGYVRGMEMLDLGSGAALYAWGLFTTTSSTNEILRWDGVTFQPLPRLFSPVRHVTVFDDGFGAKLYAASELGVHRLDGATWVSIGASYPASGYVYALTVHDDGSGPALYAGGAFTYLGPTPITGVARWTGTSWVDAGSAASGAHTINAMKSAVDENGPVLYVAGKFYDIGGQPANGVGCLKNGVWSGLGVGLADTDAENYDVTVFDAGQGAGPCVVVTGHLFSTFWSVQTRVNGQWVELSSPPGSTPTGTSLLVADLPETPGMDLLTTARISAPFSQANAIAVEACGQTGRVYCVGDGSSAACPCGNNSPAAAQAGCLHSLGGAGALRASGKSSLANESLQLEGSGMHDGPVIYYQGTQPNLIPFGDGFICATGSIVRLRILFNQAGASNDPEPGGPSLSAQGFITSPGTRYYSARYRDADLGYCTSGTFNYTNAVAVIWY